MTMITPSYLGETIEYSSLHACRSTLEDPTDVGLAGSWYRLLGQGLKIVNNALRPAANNTDELYGSNTSAGQAEYGVGVSVLFTAKQADPNCLTGFACTDHYGLLWGRGDVTSLNGYFARVTASGQVVILMNYKANTTLLASTVIKAPSFNIAHPMVFAIRNSVKEVYWDGIMVLSTTDNTLTGSSSALLKNGLGARSTVSGGTVLDDFFISPFPTLTGVSPTSGPPGGGQIMQVTGTNVNGCYARVAGTVAQGISGAVDNEVFYSPPHDAGVVTVDCATAYTFGTKIALYAPSLPNSYTYTPTLQASRPTLFALAGESPGPSSSTLRTTIQVYNPGDGPTMAEVIVHPSGSPFTSSDPGVSIKIDPHTTVYVPDLNGALLSDGFGPADLRITLGASPVTVMRIVADDGTVSRGGDVERVFASAGLGGGSTGVLLAPPDLTSAAFDIGVRTFSQDTTLSFNVRDASGKPVNSATKLFPANSYLKFSAAPILGSNGASITLTPDDNGFAMIYGIATDNLSLDIDFQRTAVLPQDPPVPMTLPLAVSGNGPQGKMRTSAQLYNPTFSPMTLRLSFLEFSPFPLMPPGRACEFKGCRPHQRPERVSLVLQAGETRFIPDLVKFLGGVGTGSIDIVSDPIINAGTPVMLFRVTNGRGPAGTFGAIVNAVAQSAALQAGDSTALIGPPVANVTMNLGVRTFDMPTSIDLTLRDSEGNVKQLTTVAYLPGAVSLRSVADIFGVPLSPNDSVSMTVQSGSALVYSVGIDGTSGDISYQLAQAQ